LLDDPLATLFAFSTVPFKLSLFAASVFAIPHLSRLLHRRFRLACTFGAALTLFTWLAILAYLPFRQTFVEIFDADQYHWYHERTLVPHGDLAEWKDAWNHKRQHTIEAALVLVFYGLLITAIASRRWKLPGSLAVAAAGWSFLEFVPLGLGLVVWDYDIFLKGIVFDSISVDISPIVFWYPSDFSIFLYTFSLIFFTASSILFTLRAEQKGSVKYRESVRLGSLRRCGPPPNSSDSSPRPIQPNYLKKCLERPRSNPSPPQR
jgi:hypothetical protein